MKKILIVVGARPNFIKITQFKKVAEQYVGRLEFKILHTGQHYDNSMAAMFFKQLKLTPDFLLNIRAKTSNAQMVQVMLGVEKIINSYLPDLIVVVGDVNSTLAAAITANKMCIKIAHVESGLRSFDRQMPEEFNRVLTDRLSDILFVTEKSAVVNLLKEGADRKSIFLVGNTMIDTIVSFREEINSSKIMADLGLSTRKFALVTMHRPANVDSLTRLKKLIDIISEVSVKHRVVFPAHPRTLKMLHKFRLFSKLRNKNRFLLINPLDYFSFQKLIQESEFVITDSGGVQEESTFYKIPCLTLRDNTERPVTIEVGTNELVTFNISAIKRKISLIENNTYKKGAIPYLWDGRATQRIVKIIYKLLY